jgi:hypothetical protein
LTGRAGVAVMFAACFGGLLVADLVRWPELADAVYFLAATLSVYYVRPDGLLPVVASPPLLFFAACLAEKTARWALAAASAAAGSAGVIGGTGDALAAAAGWLVAGTVVSVAIALLRGLPAELRALVPGARR